MTPYRRQTTKPIAAAPVRFYKVIALGFLSLAVAVLVLVVFMSAKRATIVIDTKPSPVEASGTIKVGASADDPLIGVVTSTSITLSQTFHPTGTKQVAGKATGQVTLHNDTGANQPLVPTTRLLTPDNVLFRITNRVVVPAHGTVEVAVVAGEAGKKGDIEPMRFVLPGLAADKQKLIYGVSTAPMTGGLLSIGTISDEDRTNAEKVIVQTIEDATRNKFPDLAKDQAIVLKVQTPVISSDVLVGAEASDFTLTANATVVGVIYPADKLRDWAKKLLQKRAIDDSEQIIPSTKDLAVTIDQADGAAGEATLAVWVSGVASLNPASRQLDKTIFFGKSRDEVRRYVLSLDHVRGVDVKFSPVWMLSVPYLADHVGIEIRQTE